MSNLVIKQFEIGPLNNFLYLVGDESTKEMALIDPAWDAPFLMREINNLGFTLTKVLLTHGHPDHVNGLPDVLNEHPDIPIYMSKHEAHFLTPDVPNLIQMNDGDTVNVGSLTFKTVHTPGHTPGGQCFIHDNNAIVGDTLFIDGCGRCDLPGGDPRVMYNTLYNIVMKWPDETILYTGHNYGPKITDTLAEQKKTNPYLQASSLDDFLYSRMG